MHQTREAQGLSALRLCTLSALQHLTREQRNTNFIVVKGTIGAIRHFPYSARCPTAVRCIFTLHDHGRALECVVPSIFGIYRRMRSYIAHQRIVYVCGLLPPDGPPSTMDVFDLMKVFGVQTDVP